MIEVKALRKKFNNHEVLKGVDLALQPGEVVTILGPSGSGKTTFLRCLNFLEQADSGPSKSMGIGCHLTKPRQMM